MLDCKTLLYHPTRQEAITPVRPNRLLRWDNEDVQRNELPAQLSQVLWERSFPDIQYPHSSHDPWQSDVAFLDAETLVYGAGCCVAEIAVATGAVLAEYRTADVVLGLAVDRGRRRLVVATRSGVAAIDLSA